MTTTPHTTRHPPHTTLAYLILLLTQHIAAFLLLPLIIASALLTLLWIGLPFIILTGTLLRTLATSQRRTLTHLTHQPLTPTYHPLPPTGINRRASTLLTDPATWKDLLWLTSAPLNLLILALPPTLATHALYQATTALTPNPHHIYDLTTPHTLPTRLLLLTLATTLLYLTYRLTPPTLTLYTRLNHLLLIPTAKTRLTARVQHLATSRANTIDTQAAEIRRIERDLHDGAQARLVALGMNLGMAEQIITHDPHTARTMLTEARETTRQALTELRDLVRGIHPPVLVERGLHGAVHALALTHQLPITVTIDLDGRPTDPVESAAYFAIAELLTNTAKHADATHAWVHINHGRNRLVITVTDNGHGGATTPANGLTGIARRIDAFDGTMNITSPPGGPTIITLEIPCALSSQKTWPSSKTA
ncbi:sensor histidine kinase [Nocardiopsis kunsanensis]|uniref:histidine kinase n=1 Tax=Nocardiopsis kunsanensis TaxID=141693 RepID=A0A918XG02_9ACTN|nr:histidine kinase [Nocardiopsis kunsanensis]GHD29139.1 histidine kinase [Nocardiopsis kunsanensis]